MMGEVAALALLKKGLGYSQAQETDLYLSGQDLGLTRFAGNAIHQNVFHSNAVLNIRAVEGKRVGRATTNDLNDSGIHKAVDAARHPICAGEEAPDPSKADAKEAFDLSFELPDDHPEVLAGTPMMGANVWPDIDGFADDVYAYYQDVFAVGRALMGGFEQALGLEANTLLGEVTEPPSQLRLIHYPYDPNAQDAQGIGAHTDYECFTLLRPTAPGLEVMNGAGEWIDVPYREDALVVNIGDMLEIWTNGAFVATSHRVRKVKEERYSFPLFFAADYHSQVAPLPQLLKDGETPNYEPLSAGDHLWAQTIQTFNYLKKRLADGEIELPDGARGAGTLGQHARHKDEA